MTLREFLTLLARHPVTTTTDEYPNEDMTFSVSNQLAQDGMLYQYYAESEDYSVELRARSWEELYKILNQGEEFYVIDWKKVHEHTVEEMLKTTA